MLATTATANFRVIADIEEQLGGVRLDGTSQQVFTVRGGRWPAIRCGWGCCSCRPRGSGWAGCWPT